MTRKQTALEIQNLTYHYRSNWTGRKFLVVEDISLSVDEGESFGFLGKNGAGKTTTIKAILGLTRPSNGTIKIYGVDNRDPEARAKVGYLPEQPYFYDHLTVTELVTMYAHLAGVSSQNIKATVAKTLDRVSIGHKSKSPMRALSKGLTQRVAMAQAIVADPKLLVLDEPFSGLDPVGRKEFKDLMFELKEGGTTIFVSSHILEDIEFLCDRAAILSDGKLRLVLSLSELGDHIDRHYELTMETPVPDSLNLKDLGGTIDEQGSSVRLVFQSREAAEQALKAALQNNGTISNYQAAHGNLEELFVKLVQEQGTR